MSLAARAATAPRARSRARDALPRRTTASPSTPRANRQRITAAAIAADASTTTLPLLDDARAYTHVSPGVCDACETSREAREAWVALLLGQLRVRRNAERTRVFARG